jgi:hypothetical protein
MKKKYKYPKHIDFEFTLNQIDFNFRPFSRLLLLFLKENPTLLGPVRKRENTTISPVS